jgi:hypothetical protein
MPLKPGHRLVFSLPKRVQAENPTVTSGTKHERWRRRPRFSGWDGRVRSRFFQELGIHPSMPSFFYIYNRKWDLPYVIREFLTLQLPPVSYRDQEHT